MTISRYTVVQFQLIFRSDNFDFTRKSFKHCWVFAILSILTLLLGHEENKNNLDRYISTINLNEKLKCTFLNHTLLTVLDNIWNWVINHPPVPYTVYVKIGKEVFVEIFSVLTHDMVWEVLPVTQAAQQPVRQQIWINYVTETVNQGVNRVRSCVLHTATQWHGRSAEQYEGLWRLNWCWCWRWRSWAILG